MAVKHQSIKPWGDKRLEIVILIESQLKKKKKIIINY